MDAETRKIPSHEVTYARLRDMILFGHLAPGAPVTIQGLIAELDAGMTPVREAIRRLTAEGALLPQGNRRVAVPELSAEMLEQVAFARLAIEPRLAELAALRLTTAQIDRLEDRAEAPPGARTPRVRRHYGISGRSSRDHGEKEAWDRFPS